jgi:DNA-directed RNA polymerase subunit RPC12/RpoP
VARVPITVMGYRCERCGHEWIPRGDGEQEPKVCPKCKSPYWDRPRKAPPPMTYEQFRDTIRDTIRANGAPLTWTEIRTRAKLPQAFPNNGWVRRMEADIGLTRTRDAHGIILWAIP